MKLPSKITSYKESILSKIPCILTILQDKDIEISTLYHCTAKQFKSIEEFLDTLDCLFALKCIEYDEERRVLYYVA